MKYTGISKLFIFIGFMIALIGVFIWIGGKVGIPFFKMPGDINIKTARYSVYVPIVTCIFLSIFLTIFLNLIFWVIRK